MSERDRSPLYFGVVMLKKLTYKMGEMVELVYQRKSLGEVATVKGMYVGKNRDNVYFVRQNLDGTLSENVDFVSLEDIMNVDKLASKRRSIDDDWST